MSTVRVNVSGHIRRSLPRTAPPRTGAARAVSSRARPALLTAQRRAEQSTRDGGVLPRGRAAAAAAVAAAAAAFAAASLRREDRTPVLAAEAYSIPIGRAFPGVVSACVA